jgi:hypothetical protein
MQKSDNPNTFSSPLPQLSHLIPAGSRLQQYISHEVWSKIYPLHSDEELFKDFISRVFGVDATTETYEQIRPFFAFARRNITDLFDQIDWWDLMKWPYYNRFFSPDQQSTLFQLLDIYKECLSEYRRLRKDTENKKEWLYATLRSMNELHLLFFIAMKYRDYLNTTQAKLMRSWQSRQFLLDWLRKIAVEKQGFDNVDIRKDNPLFDVTKSKKRYYQWDKKSKQYLIQDSPEEWFSEYRVDSMSLNIWDEIIEVAHIAMRDKDPWSLIQKGVRKWAAEWHHTDYTGMKIVLQEGLPEKEQEKIVNKIFNCLLDTLGDGITWIEPPALEPIKHSNFNNKKWMVRVWKCVMQVQINKTPYPIEIQIAWNEVSHIFRDEDPRSRLYHGHYKAAQLETLLPHFFPKHIYWNIKLKPPPEQNDTTWRTSSSSNL